jgi:hypothetical protein
MLETTTISSYLPAGNYPTRQAENVATAQQSGQISQRESLTLTTDQVTLSYNTESVMTYDSSMALRGTKSDGFDLLRGLVLNMFKEQGIDYKIIADDAEIDLSTLTPEKAQDLVADDGYFGVEKTSQRILDFAVGIAGGDPTRLDAIRAGVEKGFREAYDAFGGWLPDISYDTYDAVMNKLDDWAEVARSQQSKN